MTPPNIPYCISTNFLQLLELDLGQNFIEVIAEEAFVTLRKLEVLHLDANKLAAVPSVATFKVSERMSCKEFKIFV